MLIHRDALKTFKAAFAKKGGRKNLECVRIEADGSGIGSDGTILVKFTPSGMAPSPQDYPLMEGVDPVDSDLKLEPFSLPLDTAITLLKELQNSRCVLPISEYVALDVRQTNDGRTAVLGIGGNDNSQVFRPEKVELEYPNYREVAEKVQQGDVSVRLGLSTHVLEKLVTTLKALNVRTFAVTVRKPDCALEIDAENDSGKIKAYLMPALLPDRKKGKESQEPKEFDHGTG